MMPAINHVVFWREKERYRSRLAMEGHMGDAGKTQVNST